MIQHLLIGIDGSPDGEMALQYGIYLAQHFQATLHAVHVVDIVQVESPLLHDLSGAIGATPQLNLTGQMRQNLELRGQQLLAQAQQVCEAAQVPFVEHLVTGVVSTELVQAARMADLIVLGRGGLHTRLSKALFGSAVESVVRHSGTPTLVTAEHHSDMARPLLATDGSPAAMAALHLAVAMVRQLGLTLQVVHCAPTHESGQPCLNDALARLAIEGISCEADVCLGNAHEDLVRYIRDHGYDLIFMGAFGHRRFTEWMLGSTTQYLLRTCPVPIAFCHEVSD